MPTVTLKALSGATLSTLETLTVTGAFNAFQFIGNYAAAGAKTKYALYTLLFSNIDAAVSKSTTVPATASSASFYYEATDICASGGGPDDTACILLGFDAAADELAPVTFKVKEATASLPVDVPSGGSVSTAAGATVTPPPNDALFTTGHAAGAFAEWYSVFSAATLPSAGGVLTLTHGQDDLLLCVYKQGAAIGLGKPDCKELLANYAAAQNYVAQLQKEPHTEAQLLEAQRLEQAAKEAAAPCLT